MADPQEGTPCEILFLAGQPPFDCATALHRHHLVRQFPLVCTRIDHIANNPGKANMEIIAVRERECKLKQKLQMTDSLVRTGIKRFRVTESSIDLIL